MKQNEDSSQDIDKYLEDMAASGWFSIMLICMQGKTQDGVYGHICSYYLKDPVPFTGTGDMVLKMDEICNWLGAPQRTTDPRFMNKEMKKRYESAAAAHPQGLKDRMLERSSLGAFPGGAKGKGSADCNYKIPSEFHHAGQHQGQAHQQRGCELQKRAGTDTHGADDRNSIDRGLPGGACPP